MRFVGEPVLEPLSHTAAVLVEAGYDVVLLDNLSNSRRDVVERLRQITGRTLPFIEADVRDRTRVTSALREHGCTAVIHFAGLKAVGESVQKPLAYFDNNVGGTLALLQAMQEGGVSSIVFSSSATVYGVFGNDYPTPDGTGVRDYIHVMDVAEGHAEALAFLQRQAGWHAINLGTGQGYSVLDMLRAFERACGHPLPHEFKARRPGDVASCYADPAKAAAVLGWRASRGIEEMCESTWRWRRRGG